MTDQAPLWKQAALLGFLALLFLTAGLINNLGAPPAPSRPAATTPHTSQP